MTLAADLLIEGATVVDGTGGPGRRGRIAIVGDRLALPGDEVDVSASRTIDAAGLVVAPGFIDLHSHGGLVMLAEPRHEPKVRQGVTTELIGVDGNAYAPFPRHEDLEDFAVLNGGLDGRPDIAFDWSTVAQYLARYDGTTSVNVAYVVGNSPLRIAAIGWDEVEADTRAMANQRSMLGEAMEEGAFGLSTGLDYPPGAYATTEELAELIGRGGQARRLLPHARPLPAGRWVPRPVPGGDRDRAAGRRARAHHALLPPGDVPGTARAHARPRRRRTGRGPRRDLRPRTPTSGRARAC